MTVTGTTLTLWFGERGVPDRLVWEGRRYRVSDTPTPLELDLAWVTHLATIPTGWRFQGSDETGDTLMFDVVGSGNDWHVTSIYR